MKIIVIIFVTVFTSLAVQAAGEKMQVAQNSAQFPKGIHGHTIAKPTWRTDRWLWTHETEEEFFEKTGAINPKDVLQGPLVDRLNLWAEKLDQSLRSRYPEQLKNTPHPVVLVTAKSELNAWAHSLPLCFRQKVVINPAIAKEMGALYLTAEGTVSLASEQLCKKDFARTDQIDFQDLLNTLNQEHQICRLTMTGNVLSAGPGCLVPGMLTSKIGAGRALAFPSASARIELTVGLIQKLASEELVIGALFHELAHFYRAHVATPTDHLNYFYELKDANSDHQPELAQAFASDTIKARERIQGSLVMKHKSSFFEENKLMKEQNLGFYTVEQEADELALEWLAEFGLNPASMADGLLLLGAEWEKDAKDDGGIPTSACQKIRKSGWQENGGPVSVPVGNLSDAHHSPCFRVFNIDREIKAHAYKLNKNPPISLLSPSQFSALLK